MSFKFLSAVVNRRVPEWWEVRKLQRTEHTHRAGVVSSVVVRGWSWQEGAWSPSLEKASPSSVALIPFMPSTPSRVTNSLECPFLLALGWIVTLHTPLQVHQELVSVTLFGSRVFVMQFIKMRSYGRKVGPNVMTGFYKWKFMWMSHLSIWESLKNTGRSYLCGALRTFRNTWSLSLGARAMVTVKTAPIISKHPHHSISPGSQRNVDPGPVDGARICSSSPVMMSVR